MQDAFLPVFLFVACGLGLAGGLLFVSSLFNPGRPGRVARMPYESGMDPIHDTRRRFDVRFHLLGHCLLDLRCRTLVPLSLGGRGRGKRTC